jgi:hypothetical protein
MLEPYFAFGVPVILILLYILFLFIHKRTRIHYLRLILLLISAFLLVFSFQVLQESWKMSPPSLGSDAYNSNWLWLPLGVGIILTVINLWLVIQQFIGYSKNKK